MRPGEILVLTGPSGCGKSTVLRALAGLLPPDDGRMLADDAEVTTTSGDRGIVFQDNALLPWRTVGPISNWRCGCAANRGPPGGPRRNTGSTSSASPASAPICRRACPVGCGNASSWPVAWPGRLVR